MKPRNLYSAIASAALVAGCPAISHAAIEEIIVTARKSEESLQQTPVAVTALNEVMMLNRQVTEIADLRRTAPNLSILSGGTGPSSLVFVSIRGAAQVSPGGAADASVGTYIDGVYHARPTGGNLDMFDTRQVEVLRGPQGTLFGRNTTGGALNVRTNDPVGDFEGYLKVDVGNYESRKLEGVVNVPLMGDELAVRLAFRDSERDGFGDYKPYTDPNGYSMPGLDQEASAIDKNSYGRIKIKWEPAGKNFTAMLNGWWSEFEDTGQRSEVQAINDAIYGNTLAGIFAVSGFNSQHFIAQQRWNNPQWNADLSNFYTGDAELLKPMSTNENSGVALELDIELGDYMLKSISAYSETFSVGAFDLDGIPLSFQNAINEWDQEQWSQELQLSGSVGEKIDWIGGLYYFEETSTDFARSRSFGDVAAFFPGVPIEFIAPISTTTAGVFDNTSFGAFFQGNYQFSEAL
ncbi:MAG: TonB-dependent receptor, partial [Bacteroidales bacterium]|nr:TonB-dependent receptor [Bacteroidales bacterium]